MRCDAARDIGTRDALQVVGCIPMVPGGFATKAILGLFAITVPNPGAGSETLVSAIESALRVLFTVGALATGLAIPTLLMRMRKTAGSPSCHEDVY